MLAAALLLLAYTLARPGPALVGLARLLLLGAARPQAQRPTAGGRALAAGDPARAAAEFLKEAGARHAPATPRSTTRARPRSTAGGSTWRAARWRRRPSRSTRRSGTARSTTSAWSGCSPPQADTSRAEELLDDAADRLRQALMLEPSSARAKWNLELAERRRPPPPPAGRRRRRRAAVRRRRRRQSRSRPPSRRARELTQSQAEQILNSMERRERETREEQQRRLQTGSAGGVKDW